MNFINKIKKYIEQKKLEHNIFFQQRDLEKKLKKYEQIKIHKARCFICRYEMWICDDYNINT
jgi:hypothetical protein